MSRLRSMAVAMLLLQLLACHGERPAVMEPLKDAALSVSRGELLDYATETAAGNPGATGDFSLSELTTRVPIGIEVKSSTSGYVRVNGQLIATNVRTQVAVTSLEGGADIVIEHLDAAGALVTQRVHTMPKAIPSYKVIGKTSEDGEIALTPGGEKLKSYLLLLDGSGKIIFYRRSPDQQFSNFRKYDFGGKVFYTYISGVAILPLGYAEGKVTILDNNFVKVSVIDGVLPNAAKGRPLVQSENHEFLLLGENHYLVSGYYGHKVDGIPNAPAGVQLASSVLQEVKDGVVVFEWESTDHPELYEQAEEGNTYSTTGWSDYVHFNSIEVDPRDGNFVASFRNLNTIMKIDRRTGQILWRFGGRADDFGLTPNQTPQGQHSARILADGSMIYFDNNTTCGGVVPKLPRFYTPNPQRGNLTACDERDKNSRVVKVFLDESRHSVTSFQEWRFANDAGAIAAKAGPYQFTSFRGSVQYMSNGHMFLGFGSNSPSERDVMEWDPATGRPVFELYFNFEGSIPAQADVGSYRAWFSH